MDVLALMPEINPAVRFLRVFGRRTFDLPDERLCVIEGYQNRAMADLSKAISQTVQDRQLKMKRKSYALYRMALFSMTLGDP